jgi:hypothetical protein
MHLRHVPPLAVIRTFGLLLVLAAAQPALAQETAALRTLRGQYDTLMADLEHLAAARGETVLEAQARKGRDAMQSLTDEQLADLYSRTRVPDLSVATTATRFLVRRAKAGAQARAGEFVEPLSADFPGPVAIPGGCNGVDTAAESRYALHIIKEVANSILAAATFVCTQDILGTNGAAACIPFAIAADIANGFFNTATFCAGEGTANQVDANFNRLDHLHNDLTNGVTTIVNTSNANTTAIINNANVNTAAIVTNDNANTTAIVTNDNANTATIISNDNTNTATIITNANANKNELRDLILRTQIEADLAMVDGAAVAALYEVPAVQGGYLDLVMAIVTQTIANIQAAGAGVGNAGAFLSKANAAKAAGDFKTAYALYRRAYKAAGK